MRAPPSRFRARAAAPVALVLALGASASGQERSATPLLSTDAGAIAPTAVSPDAVRPVARRIGFREAVDQAIGHNPNALNAAADIRRVGGVMEEVR